MCRSTIARLLLSLNALVVGVGGFLADFNATHIYNPNWPPHNNFHDGQTMAVEVSVAKLAQHLSPPLTYFDIYSKDKR